MSSREGSMLARTQLQDVPRWHASAFSALGTEDTSLAGSFPQRENRQAAGCVNAFL